MNPVITVVIPVYNCERYISRAAESVLSQPMANAGNAVELVIVDDGSADGSGEICDKLSEKYGAVRVFHKENGGVSSARNFGIERAEGKYIAFLDSDDWWEPDFFDENIYNEFMSEASADVYQFAFREADQYCSLEKRYSVEDKTINYNEAGFGRYDWSIPCSFVYKLETLRRNGVKYPVSKAGEDGPFVEMAMYNIGSFTSINKLMFTYWENPSSCVHTIDPITNIEESYKSLLQERDYFEKIGVCFDTDITLVWHAADMLPAICGVHGYKHVKRFMSEKCMEIVKKRPDIRFRQELWDRIEAWKTCPFKFWMINKVKEGAPLMLKKICYSIPGVRRTANYCFNRYYRGFQRIQGRCAGYEG